MTNKYLVASIVFTLLLVGLHVLGFLEPSCLNWGFHFLGFLPTEIFFIYLALSFVVTLFAIKGKGTFVSTLASFMENAPLKFLGIAVVLFVALSFLLKIEAPMWGDGSFIVRNFSEALRGISPLYLRNEPLSTQYYFLFVTLFQTTSYAAFLQAFWIATVITGIGFVIVAFYLSRNLTEEPRSKLLIFLLLCSGPYMQLFFGYVETYSMVALSVSLYVLVSILFLKRKISFVWVALVFFIQGVSHYLTMLFFPSFMFLAYKEWKNNGLQNVTLGAGIIGAGILMTLWLADFNTYVLASAAPHKHYLSFSPSTEQFESESLAYTFFSLYHVIDIFNIVVFFASGGLFLLGMALLRDRFSLWQHQLTRFFSIALLPVIVFICFVKFDLGAAKDWDVIAPLFSMLYAFAGWAYLQRTESNPTRVLNVVIIITMLNSLVWCYFNTSAEAGVQRTYSLLDKRNLSQFGHYAASLHLAQYYHQVKNNAPVAGLWQQYSRKFPHDRRGYLNTITNIESIYHNDYDRVNEIYEAWFKADTVDYATIEQYANFCMKAGNYFFEKEIMEKAKQYYQKVLIVNPFSSRAVNNVGSVYAMQDSTLQAIVHFRRAIELDSLYGDALYNLGVALETIGNNNEGKMYIERAASLGNSAAQQELQGK
ncbi:MAG: hypothetical protein EPO24_04705 [Bacteroidetes bacterium]|nr:MAG: hypothetical protein EPO24_04705 [Bacteroidota bacterium]